MTISAESTRSINTGCCARLIRIALVSGFGLLFAVSAAAEQPTKLDPDALVNDAREALPELVTESSDKEVINHAREAQAVLIVTDYIKAGLLLGMKGGHGVTFVRHGDRWIGLAFYNVSNPNIGLQAGFAKGKAVSFMMGEEARGTLTRDWVRGGATVGGSAGRAGADLGNHGMGVYTRAQTKGLFAGATVDMSTIKPNDQLNARYYGRPVSPTDMLMRGKASNAQSEALKAEIIKATSP